MNATSVANGSIRGSSCAAAAASSELDREHRVPDHRGHPDVVDRDLAEAGRQALGQDFACDVFVADRGADDAVCEILNTMPGLSRRGLFDEREQLFVAAGERADDEDLAREEGEGVGLADLHAEVEVRGGERLGFLEPARHHRLERLVESRPSTAAPVPSSARVDVRIWPRLRAATAWSADSTATRYAD